jgi:hypothetical protein
LTSGILSDRKSAGFFNCGEESKGQLESTEKGPAKPVFACCRVQEKPIVATLESRAADVIH